MKNLVFASLAAAGLLQASSGCIFSSDDDDDDGISDGGDDADGGDGDDGGDGSGDGILWVPDWICPPDAETITFFITEVGATTPIEETFGCDEIDPDAIAVNAGDYDVEALPEGTIGPFASQFGSFDGIDGDLIEDLAFDFTQDGGFLDVAWTIQGEDPSTACAKGETVEVVATLLDDPGTPFIDSVPCEDGVAIIPVDDLLGWPIGEYTLDVVLIDAADVPLTEPYPVVDVFIDFADHLSPDVGTVDLVLK